MNNTASFDSAVNQNNESSQTPKNISLSLKRKQCAVKELKDDKEILGEKPISKRRSLSLKKNREPSKKNVKSCEEIPEVLKPGESTEINGGIPVLDNSLNLDVNASKTKEKSLDTTPPSTSENVNAFMNKTDLDIDKQSTLKQTSAIDVNSNTIYCSPEVPHNLSTPEQSCLAEQNEDCVILSDKVSLVSVSSATEIGHGLNNSQDTIIYGKPSYSLSFGLSDCKDVNVTTKNGMIKKIFVSHDQNNTNVDCELIANSQESDVNSQERDVNSQALDVNSQELDDNNLIPDPNKKQLVSVNLEIKKKNPSTSEVQSKVLILNTNAIEKLSHVIVQPPSYKSLRRKIPEPSKISSINKGKSRTRSARKNGKVSVDGAKLNQIRIDTLFKNTKDLNGIAGNKEKINSELRNGVRNCENDVLGHDDMSRIARADTARSDGIGRLSRRVSKEENVLSRSSKMSPMSQIRASNSEAPQLPSPRGKNESSSSCSPRRRNIDSLQFNLPSKTKNSKTAVVPRDIPHYKIVAGTHFAVDAFCYGDIPGVKNYFLTHFHSDHYSGLKKSFNKSLFCTQITADLCTSRLGVNVKHIHVINIDETLRVDGVEVTAIDANHCPGAVMLLFTLPNGKTLLHTGDFRATPAMESHPAFWNSDIHTIYLDTTYCNPRYDFPTQDQSLEMALHILRQKKVALEKVGKKFTSVLIVCGTYTIGKEKFFLGLAKRVGCSVWACPEKDKVLQTVERRSFSHAAPQSCQLHVVPMRDLTHEKLRSYLDSLQGPFSEVVAFKPSGWENGKTTPTTKDMVTVHGIPYSEHSSFSEMIRFVNFLKPKQVVPTVDISGGVKAVQKYFPCPLVYKEDLQCQTKLTDFFNVQNRQQISAVS